LGVRTSYTEIIRSVLAKSPKPMDIENVRVTAGLKNWESTKSILLEMLLQGMISGHRTGRSWIFWVNSSRKPGVGD